MSRIGRLPIDIPAGVDVTIDGPAVTVKGPKGSLGHTIPAPLTAAIEDGQVLVSRPDDERASRSLHGLTRTLIANQIIGVTEGYTKGLEVVGTGYRVQSKGANIEFALGYSHPITVEPPAGISFTVEGNNKLTVSGIDKQAVGEAPRTSARCASPSPTRARVCGTPARSFAARPERVGSNHGAAQDRYSSASQRAPSRPPPQEGLRHRRSSAPGGHPLGPARVRAGRRRQQGPHPGIGLDARGRPAHVRR